MLAPALTLRLGSNGVLGNAEPTSADSCCEIPFALTKQGLWAEDAPLVPSSLGSHGQEIGLREIAGYKHPTEFGMNLAKNIWLWQALRGMRKWRDLCSP
jgi:hypothetical protein